MDSSLLTNIITISLGLIAGLIALYQVKMNIITSSRIKWIEGLREAVTDFSYEVSTALMALVNIRSEGLKVKKSEIEKVIEEFYPTYLEATLKSDRSGKKILLHLNSEEEDHRKMEELVTRITQHLEKKTMAEINQQEIDTDLNELVQVSKKVLKKEWDRSKKLRG